MKHLFYIFSLIAIAGCLASCSKDNDEGWLYGDKQKLEGTEWTFTPVGFADVYSGHPNIPAPKETLRFGSSEFTMMCTNWIYNIETQEARDTTTSRLGNYKYEHPKLMLTLEDGSEIEAWITSRNTIHFYGTDGHYKDFKRE